MTGLLAPAWALALSALASVGPSGPSVSIPLDRERWVISADNFKLDPAERQLHNGEVVEFLGRRCMRLSKGLIYARALDVDFRDGVIETDIAFAANGVFFGVAFRVESADQYEVIFLRPGASGSLRPVQVAGGRRPGWICARRCGRLSGRAASSSSSAKAGACVPRRWSCCATSPAR